MLGGGAESSQRAGGGIEPTRAFAPSGDRVKADVIRALKRRLGHYASPEGLIDVVGRGGPCFSSWSRT
jgi:hypothetical protein